MHTAMSRRFVRSAFFVLGFALFFAALTLLAPASPVHAAVPNLTINDVSLNEGNSGTTSFNFTVSLDSPAGPGGVTFDIATADGTATALSDYTAKSLTAQTIPMGSSTYTFTVLVNGDTTVEPNETFFVNVTNVTGATVTDGQGQGTIVNDDMAPLTLVVTRAADDVNDANCMVGNCTLRQAVNASDANDPGMGNHNTITFSSLFNTAQTINLTVASGPLNLTAPVTITGPGANLLTIDGQCMGCQPGGTPNGGTKHFYITGTGTYAISGMTLQHGRGDTSGSGSGGAVDVFAMNTVTLTNMVLRDNATLYRGGGVHVDQGATLTVIGSAIIGNTAVDEGGGITVFSGNATIVNSTIAGNSGSVGGDIENDANTVTVINSTIANSTRGYGIDNRGTLLNVTNSLIVNNTDGDLGVKGINGTNSHNITGSFTFADADPTQPQNHGGLTPTLALLPGSPAIDAGDNPTCIAPVSMGGAGGVDQRGITRPQGTTCDIGAFESRGFTFSMPSGNAQSAGINTAFANPAALTVSDMNNELVPGGTVTFTITPGMSGASATFPIAGSCSMSMSNTVATCPISGSGASGTATSPTFTANGTIGTFTIVATTSGVSMPTTFTETNILLSPQAFVVTTNADNANDTNCTAMSCTLRQAVNLSNATTGMGTNTITFASPFNTAQTITLAPALGQLTLSHAVTITGPGSTLLTVARSTMIGTPKFRLFQINGGITASIRGLTVTGGDAGTDYGGGIADQGPLTLTDVTLSGNTASFGGGMVVLSATLNGSNVTVSSNRSANGGGGLGIMGGSTAILANVTVTGNTAGSTGGGFYIPDTSAVTLSNATVSGNSALFTGGGGGMRVEASGVLTLTNGTVTGNSAPMNSGGISVVNTATLNATRSIIAGNTNGDVGGNGINGTNVNNLTMGNALLAPLGNYGGTTQTQPPLPGSPAIDAGGMGCSATDQRGIMRPVGSACDIGAVESQGFTFTSPSGNGQTAATGQSFPSPVGLTVSDMNSEPVNGGSVTFTITPGTGGANATFPAAGSCTLSMSNTVAVCPITGSGASGTAASPAFTANDIPGSFTIVASTVGVPTASNQTFTETITNSAPTLAQPANVTILEDAGAQNVMLTGIGPGASDTGQTLTVTATSDTPTVIPNPVVTYTSPNATATLAFTPVANANTPTTPATITVTVKDNGGTAGGGADTTTKTFTVTVTPVNDAPTFTKGADVTVSPNSGAYAQPFATAISPGPPDESAQTLAFAVTANTNAALFAVAPTVSPTGVLSFTPAMNATGSATLTLVLKDNGGTANGGVDTSVPQTFTITVSGNAPTAVPDSYTVITGATLTVPAATGVLANDTRGTPAATITANTQPAHGTLTFTRADGSFTYVSAAPYVGPDSFTYTLSNGNGSNGTGSSTATVTLTVTAATLQSLTTTAPTGAGSGNSGSATTPTLRAGTRITLATMGTYSNGTTGNVSGLMYTGYNPNIVNVDANGVITGIAAGTTTITIIGPGGITTTITVTVTGGTGSGLMNPNPQPMAHATVGTAGTPQAQPSRAPIGNGSSAQPQGANATSTPTAPPTPQAQPGRH